MKVILRFYNIDETGYHCGPYHAIEVRGGVVRYLRDEPDAIWRDLARITDGAWTVNGNSYSQLAIVQQG